MLNHVEFEIFMINVLDLGVFGVLTEI